MSTRSVSSQKRLQKELLVLLKTPFVDPDILLRPSVATSLLSWTALLKGPCDSPYKGGVYQLDITCPSDYPLSPPSMKFVTKIFHPNVAFLTGEICLDILKNQWSPAWSLTSSCRAVLSLLTDPNDDSPLNCDAGNMVRAKDWEAHDSVARMYVVENAMVLRWPEEGEGMEKEKEKEKEKEEKQSKGGKGRKVAPAPAA